MIIGEFIAPIEVYRGGRQDFDDEGGEAFIGFGCGISGVAGDHDIGVVVAARRFELGFHVGDVDRAATAPELVAEDGGEVERDRDVGIAGPGHGVGVALAIFVFGGAVGFLVEVGLGAEGVGVGDHGEGGGGGWYGVRCLIGWR